MDDKETNVIKPLVAPTEGMGTPPVDLSDIVDESEGKGGGGGGVDEPLWDAKTDKGITGSINAFTDWKTGKPVSRKPEGVVATDVPIEVRIKPESTINMGYQRQTYSGNRSQSR